MTDIMSGYGDDFNNAVVAAPLNMNKKEFNNALYKIQTDCGFLKNSLEDGIIECIKDNKLFNTIKKSEPSQNWEMVFHNLDDKSEGGYYTEVPTKNTTHDNLRKIYNQENGAEILKLIGDGLYSIIKDDHLTELLIKLGEENNGLKIIEFIQNDIKFTGYLKKYDTSNFFDKLVELSENNNGLDIIKLIGKDYKFIEYFNEYYDDFLKLSKINKEKALKIIIKLRNHSIGLEKLSEEMK